MTNEQMAFNTKRALAASLKKLATREPFDKVTVSQIIADCDVNRKTFYYHFEDIYDLLRWTLKQEIPAHDSTTTYRDSMGDELRYAIENHRFLDHVVHSSGRRTVEDFYYPDLQTTIRAFVERSVREQELTVSETFQTYLIDYYTEATARSIFDWIDRRDAADWETFIRQADLVFASAVPAALRAAAEQGA